MPLHQVLIDQNPAQRNEHRRDDKQVPSQAGRIRRLHWKMRTANPAQHNQPHAGSRANQSKPSNLVEAFVSKNMRAHRKNHRHRAHHQTRMGDVGQLEPPELDNKLHRNAKKRSQQQGPPLARAQIPRITRTLPKQNRQQPQARKEKAVKHHVAHAHLPQRNFAEIKTGAPQTTGRRASRETKRRPVTRCRCRNHLSNVAHSNSKDCHLSEAKSARAYPERSRRGSEGSAMSRMHARSH